jgi:hypothetical protein
MEKQTKGTKICTTCGVRKPLSAFLSSSVGYTKTYSKICKTCRAKQFAKRFITHAEDDDDDEGGGGKSSGLVIDYEAKLAMQQQQEEAKEAKEETKEEAHEEEDEIKLKKEEKREQDKTKKSRVSKNLIDRLAKMFAKKKSTLPTGAIQTLYDTYKLNHVLDGINAAGALKTMGPEWGKRMADILRFSGAVSMLALSFKYYESFSGKVTESVQAEPQNNELLEVTKDIINPHF